MLGQSFFTITFDSTYRTKRRRRRPAMELKRLQSPWCRPVRSPAVRMSEITHPGRRWLR